MKIGYVKLRVMADFTLFYCIVEITYIYICACVCMCASMYVCMYVCMTALKAYNFPFFLLFYILLLLLLLLLLSLSLSLSLCRSLSSHVLIVLFYLHSIDDFKDISAVFSFQPEVIRRTPRDSKHGGQMAPSVTISQTFFLRNITSEYSQKTQLHPTSHRKPFVVSLILTLVALIS